MERRRERKEVVGCTSQLAVGPDVGHPLAGADVEPQTAFDPVHGERSAGECLRSGRDGPRSGDMAARQGADRDSGIMTADIRVGTAARPLSPSLTRAGS